MGDLPKSLIRPACVTALAILATLPALFPVPASAKPSGRPLVTGVSDIVESDAANFVHVRAAGARRVQLNLRWALIAPSSPPADWNPEDPADPHYDWTEIDLQVIHAVQQGLVPVLTVTHPPQWAQRCTNPEYAQDSAACNLDPAALSAFAVAAARRYSGSFGGLPKVSYWQGLNEPNLSLFFNPQYENGLPVSATLYRTLANAFYAAINSVDPSNVVLLAGLGPIAVPGYTIGPMQFARELLCMRGRERFRPAPGDCEGGVAFDIFDIHPYTTGGPTHTGGVNDVELGDLSKLQALIQAADSAGRVKGQFRRTPLWVTEFSWDSNPPDPGGLPMSIETRWVPEALFRAWSAGVSNFFWFSIRDFAREAGEPFSESLETGLYFRGATPEQDQPKEFMAAFRFPFVAYPQRKGLFFWGRTPDSAPGRVVVQVFRGNRWRRVSSVHAAKTGIFTGLAPSRYGRSKRGRARAIYQGESSIPFSMKPVPDFRHNPFG